MIIAVFVALASAASYGVSDFLGGLGALRLRVARSTLVGYLVATVVVALALPFSGGVWSAGAIRWGALTAVFAITGVLAFYAALVSGPISLSAPLVGVIESAVPVAVAVALGERLGWVTWLAVVAACAGGALVSVKLGSGERMTPRAFVLAIVAGVLLGASILTLDAAPADSGLIPAFGECAVGFLLVAAAVVLGRVSRGFGRLLARLDATDASAAPAPGIRLALPSIVAGVLIGAGNVLLLLALRAGPLAVVTVLVDLYPVATVLLAWFVARERLSPLQFLGVGLAVGASALFAAA